MDAATRRAAAAELAQAEGTQTPILPLTQSYPDLDVRDAYTIQLINVNNRLEAGAAIRGHKIGLTSVAMQGMFGVHEPDYGHLLSDMFVHDGGTVPLENYIQPKVEIEIAFVLGQMLGGGGITAADVLRGTDFVVPAIEIIDSRITDWKIKLPDTVADNASSGGVVLGGRATKLDGLDLRLSGAILQRSGHIVETGLGAAVLGNPVVAVAWLANKLHEVGITLEEGDVVLSGACTRAVDVAPGDAFHAEFGGLGVVSVAFD
jgi:2-keto-4-pentenoate hydratase